MVEYTLELASLNSFYNLRSAHNIRLVGRVGGGKVNTLRSFWFYNLTSLGSHAIYIASLRLAGVSHTERQTDSSPIIIGGVTSVVFYVGLY